MAVLQISQIQIRRGPVTDIPSGTPDNNIGLEEGELGLAVDTGGLYVGAPNLLAIQSRKPTADNPSGEFPYGNLQILTETTRNTEELIQYTYRYRNLSSNPSFPGPGNGIDWTYDQAKPWTSDNQTVTRYIQERLDEVVSVKSYGAVGDGVTDDTYAIWSAAIDVIQTNAGDNVSGFLDPNGNSTGEQITSSRRKLYFPAGTYIISRPILLPPFSTWVGDGIGKTIIKMTTTTQNSVVSNINVVNGGSGYLPTTTNISFSGGGGSSATANPIITNGIISHIDVSNGGSGYTQAYVTIGGYGATAVPVITSGVITHINILNGGTGYTSAHTTVTFSDSNGGPGTGATGYVIVTGGIITGIVISNGGSGYINPIIQINGDGDGFASATAIASGIIQSIIVTNGGQNYSSANVIIGVPGSGAKATPTIVNGVITGIIVNNSGTGYSSSTTSVVFGDSSGTGTGASGFVTLTNGAVTSITITNGGQGYTTPTISIIGNGTGATASVAAVNGVISYATVLTEGSGYSNELPAIEIVNVGQGASAIATVLSGKVTGVNLVSAGSNYPTQTHITISGDGSGATATATIKNGVITAINLVNQGNGYTTPPSVTITGGDGTATATALISSGSSSKCVIETVDDGITLEDLNTVWTAPSPIPVPRTENQIGQAIANSRQNGILPTNICVEGITFLHMGNEDIVHLNRASKTKWINCRFEGQQCGTSKQLYNYTLRNAISDINIVNAGSGYTTASLAITGGDGFGASAKISTYKIVTLAVSNGGSGYVTGDTLTLNGGTGTLATVTVASVDTAGSITSATLLSAGIYSTLPVVNSITTINNTTATASGATFNISFGVNSISIINRGNNYTTPPAITINGDGTGATALATVVTIPNEIVDNSYSGNAMYNYRSDSIGIFIDGLGSVGGTLESIGGPFEHLFIGCEFYNTTYAFAMTDQVSNISIIGCSFERHYRGFNIGEKLWYSNATSTTNIPLSGTFNLPSETLTVNDPINGTVFLTAQQRINLTGQNIASQNGLYEIISGAANGTYSLIPVTQFGLFTDGDDNDFSNALMGKSNGPTGMRITNCNFKRIIGEAIYVGKGRDIICTSNTFEDTIGRGPPSGSSSTSSWGENNLSTPETPIIYFDSLSNNCSSIGDWFARSNSDSIGINRHRVLIDAFSDHLFVTGQEYPSLPYMATKSLSTILNPATVWSNTGIELPISKLIWNYGTNTYDEIVDTETYNVDYVISVPSASGTPRLMGEISLMSIFNAVNPAESDVYGQNNIKVSFLNAGISFQYSIIKYTNGQTYIRIYYMNTSGNNSYLMSFSVRKLPTTI